MWFIISALLLLDTLQLTLSGEDEDNKPTCITVSGFNHMRTDQMHCFHTSCIQHRAQENFRFIERFRHDRPIVAEGNHPGLWQRGICYQEDTASEKWDWGFAFKILFFFEKDSSKLTLVEIVVWRAPFYTNHISYGLPIPFTEILTCEYTSLSRVLSC